MTLTPTRNPCDLGFHKKFLWPLSLTFILVTLTSKNNSRYLDVCHRFWNHYVLLLIFVILKSHYWFLRPWRLTRHFPNFCVFHLILMILTFSILFSWFWRRTVYYCDLGIILLFCRPWRFTFILSRCWRLAICSPRS